MSNPKTPPGNVYRHTEILRNANGDPYPVYSWSSERKDETDAEYTGGQVHSWRHVTPSWCKFKPGDVFRATLDDLAVTCPICLDRIVERQP